MERTFLFIVRSFQQSSIYTKLIGIVLALLLVPYGASRLASPWRQLKCRELPASIVARSQPDVAATSPSSLRIGCYNIAHGRGLAESNHDGGDSAVRTERLKQIAQYLDSQDLDVIVLNEVDFGSSWSYGVNQAEVLAQEAGFPYWTEQRNLDFRLLAWTWRFGNAILSKRPIQDAGVINLPGYAAWETVLAGKKRAHWADVRFGDTSVRIAAVHLSHRAEEVRVASAEELIQQADAANRPFLVLGDMNSTPVDYPGHTADAAGRNAMDLLRTKFQTCPSLQPDAEEFYTYRTDRPNRMIDWILLPSSFRFDEYHVHTVEYSDHRLVSARVTWFADP
ncbi:MAG: endonuclease/exonuclease/phosphatase family protein [Planctomycetales bacterium]|nr:endonuclease/exonuclease/phosphatase family protein [Planctomycetales bacterium]